MKETLEVLQILQGTALPNLLVIAGLLLVLLGFAGKIGAIIELSPSRQKIAGFLGFILLIFGAGLFALPAPEEENDHAVAPPQAGGQEAAPPAVYYTYEMDYGSPIEISGGGGSGGDEMTVSCPNGYAATGLIGGSGQFIDRIGLQCNWLEQNGNAGDVTSTEMRGGGGGSEIAIICPGNQFMVGIRGRSGDFVDQLSGHCQNVEISLSSETMSAGGSGGNLFDARCPSGYVLTGIHGRSGGFVDQVNFICNKVKKIRH